MERPVMQNIGGTRRRGRPSRVVPTTAVCVRLSMRMHDALIRFANDRGVTVSGAIRRAIGRELLYPGNSAAPSRCYRGDAANAVDAATASQGAGNER
jgi:hypothetical protein